MEFRGTKGEWKKFDIVNHSQHHTYFKISSSTTEDSRHGESICNITTRDSERAEANSKLIEQSPEMLRVLKLLIDDNVIQDSHYLDIVEETIYKALK